MRREFEAAARRTECLHCASPLRFEPARGWVHPDGGFYVMRCPECGWMGAPHPSPARCPQCKSPKLRDDHVARPKRS